MDRIKEKLHISSSNKKATETETYGSSDHDYVGTIEGM